MRCENHFCIYWKNYRCQLNQISLDIQGICQECIYLELEEDVMEAARTVLKNRLEHTT